jgi:hypothetical protein
MVKAKGVRRRRRPVIRAPATPAGGIVRTAIAHVFLPGRRRMRRLPR